MDRGIKFEKSKAKGKKYAAILPDGKRIILVLLVMNTTKIEHH